MPACLPVRLPAALVTGLYQGCKVALSTAWILLREDEVALRLVTGSPVRYRYSDVRGLGRWHSGASPAHSGEFQL